jgi:hypothetical protein
MKGGVICTAYEYCHIVGVEKAAVMVVAIISVVVIKNIILITGIPQVGTRFLLRGGGGFYFRKKGFYELICNFI